MHEFLNLRGYCLTKRQTAQVRQDSLNNPGRTKTTAVSTACALVAKFSWVDSCAETSWFFAYFRDLGTRKKFNRVFLKTVLGPKILYLTLFSHMYRVHTGAEE